MKKILSALAVVGLTGAAVAADGAGFDPSSLMSSAESTVTGIASAVGTILTAAAAIYLAFLGWRKFRDATNKV